FGPGFDSRNLPGNWSSTANATEGLLFAAKDMIAVLDDFAPGGIVNDQARLHRDADRIFRNVGNQAGRQRMSADGSLRVPKPPRALPLSTGEEVPRGHSCRARLVIVEMSPGVIEKQKLSLAQAKAAHGAYAMAMSGYLRWLAGQHDQVRVEIKKRIAE